MVNLKINQNLKYKKPPRLLDGFTLFLQDNYFAFLTGCWCVLNTE